DTELSPFPPGPPPQLRASPGVGAADRVETGWVGWRRLVLGLTPQATYGRPHSGAEEGFPDSHLVNQSTSKGKSGRLCRPERRGTWTVERGAAAPVSTRLRGFPAAERHTSQADWLVNHAGCGLRP